MPVNEITASKAEYALALTALGLKVQSVIPERFVPPVVVIAPGGTYLQPDTIANRFIMQLELMVVASNAVNAKASEALDAAIEKILTDDSGLALVKSVGQPYALEVNNAQYLSANISVEIRIEI